MTLPIFLQESFLQETLVVAIPTISVGEVLWKMANHTQGDAPLLPSERYSQFHTIT